MTDKEPTNKSQKVEKVARKSRKSFRQGELYIPEDVKNRMTDRVLRWVADNASNVSRKLDLGYEPISASQYPEIAASTGDFTLSGGKNTEGDMIVKTGKMGTKHILMSIPKDLYQQYRKEQEEEVRETEVQMGRNALSSEHQYEKRKEHLPK